jgi:hypothetical protein
MKRPMMIEESVLGVGVTGLRDGRPSPRSSSQGLTNQIGPVVLDVLWQSGLLLQLLALTNYTWRLKQLLTAS